MKRSSEKSEKLRLNKISTKGGAYALTVSVIVLAILVVVNIIASTLPATLTKLDISSSQLYSITSNTKVVVNALQKDVTLYWVVQADQEDDIIENLLEKYESLSDHLEVVKKNPDIYPTFTALYTDESVPNNSIIVECGDRYRYISYNEIYIADVDYSTYSYVYSFDGEGAITSAIDYVVSEDLPCLYVLEGHGEAELPDEFTTQIAKENMDTVSFSLLNEDEIPEDADCIIIYAPASDISEEEKDILTEYVDNGGKLLVMAGPVEDGTLTNLYAVLSEYGVSAAEGIVVETDRNYYAFRAPYILLPEIESSDITDPLTESNYYVIVPIAQGMTVSSSSKGTVTELLTTSDTSFSKTAGYDLSTYEKEDGDTDGPFTLAVSVETDAGGGIVWVSSSNFIDELYNAYSSGANINFTMNALSSLVGESEAVSIRSKSLGYNYLTINESTASMLKTVMIGVMPMLFVITGIATVIERRKRRNVQG